MSINENQLTSSEIQSIIVKWFDYLKKLSYDCKEPVTDFCAGKIKYISSKLKGVEDMVHFQTAAQPDFNNQSPFAKAQHALEEARAENAELRAKLDAANAEIVALKPAPAEEVAAPVVEEAAPAAEEVAAPAAEVVAEEVAAPVEMAGMDMPVAGEL